MQHEVSRVPTAPNSPTSRGHTRDALSMSQLSDSSVGSDFSAFSVNSTSTTATTASGTSRKSSRADLTEPLTPSPPIRPGHRKALSRDMSGGITRPLALLRKDLDFVPQTPAGKGAVPELKTPRPPLRLRQATSADAAVAPGEGEWKTPRRGPPRMTSLGEAPADPSTPGRTRGHRRAQTVDTAIETPKARSMPTSPRSPTSDREAGALFAAAVEANGSGLARRPGVRTMEEKKALLGSMMGNVDTLVEGVRKAGIWGLG